MGEASRRKWAKREGLLPERKKTRGLPDLTPPKVEIANGRVRRVRKPRAPLGSAPFARANGSSGQGPGDRGKKSKGRGWKRNGKGGWEQTNPFQKGG